MDADVQAKIQKLQLIEENLHALLAQKQQVQAELMEVESAKAALDGQEKGYQIVGNIMVERPTKELHADLDERLSRAKTRLESLEKQESQLKKKAEGIQQEVMQRMQAKEEQK